MRYLLLATAMGFLIFSCSEEPELLQAPSPTGSGPLTSSLNGTETLGDIPIPLAAGTGIVVGGVGTRTVQPGTIAVNVPGGATVKQVLIYWEGNNPTAVGDDQITVEGNTVTGTQIGGPTYFYTNAFTTTFRADITDLDVVTAGANSIEVSGMNYVKNNGAGVLVIYDDGSGAAQIGIKDGNDCAYYAFAPTLDTTVPQTFTFTAAPMARQATLAILASSVEPNRPNVIRVTINSVATDLVDPLHDSGGGKFDAYMTTVNIPAGATEMTLQCLSLKDPSSGFTGDPASLVWNCAGLSVPPPPLASIGDYVWLDENEDGIQDPSEEGIADVTVYLFKCGNVTPIDDTTTDANGYYLFDKLLPGEYQVMFVLVPGLKFSPRDAGANDALDSDALPTSGMTVCTTLDADENDLTWDAGMYEPEEVIACRMTGGGNGEAEETNPARVGNGPNINVYTCGGQAGAPTALQPQPWGEWTHSQQRGPAGSFTFHGGTASAPRGSEIDWIQCSDPGWCVQARKAPAKQLDFGGVGTFHNLKGVPRSISDYVTVGESLHWFEVNVDDLGEPGKAGKQPPAAEMCDPLGFGRNGGPELADCGCPDFYRIRIYAGPTDSSIIIYEAYGYIVGGNFQIHPPTGRDRKELDTGDGKGGGKLR
jgi:hypothetical protein